MKWIVSLTALVATLGTHVSVEAGLFSFGTSCGAQKSCGAKGSQPDCCKETITRPCTPQIFNYQRKQTKAVPRSCKPNDCCPSAPAGCSPTAKSCAAPAAADCTPAGDAASADCAAPVAAACAPAAGGCSADASGACGAGACCDDGCCAEDACAIAELIFESQIACYAKDRARAIDRLGDRYSCKCNPEIMAAFVYSLNDTDERVRAEAADEIGDQVRKYGCCCMTDRALDALKIALADCDAHVSHQAEEALKVCGYCVEDHCSPKCGVSLLPSCGSNLLSNLLSKFKSSCSPKCGADAAAECGAKGSDKCCPPSGAACTPGCKAPEGAAGGGETEPSPSAADAPAAPKPAPAPPEAPAPKAEPKVADDKTASTTRPRSVLTRLFGLVKK